MSVTFGQGYRTRRTAPGVRAGAAISDDLVAEDTDRAATAYRDRREARTAGRR